MTDTTDSSKPPGRGTLSVVIPQRYEDAAELYYRDPFFKKVIEVAARAQNPDGMLTEGGEESVLRGECGRTITVEKPLVGMY